MLPAVGNQRGKIDIPLSPWELNNIRGPGAVKDVSSATVLPDRVAAARPAAW
jgi:hypothetical protein